MKKLIAALIIALGATSAQALDFDTEELDVGDFGQCVAITVTKSVSVFAIGATICCRSSYSDGQTFCSNMQLDQ